MKRMRMWLYLCVFILCSKVYVHAEDIETNMEDVFVDIPEVFVFASGVGAWSSEVTINSDGTFTGNYHDMNDGIADEGYPRGQMYLCVYQGEISDLNRVSDTIYEMQMLYYETQEIAGKSEIIDEIRYDYTTPYGLEDAQKLILFLPGTLMVMLPERAKYSCLWSYDESAICLADNQYVLYNENEDICFFGLAKEINETTEDENDIWTEEIRCNSDGYILPDLSTDYYTKEGIAYLTLQEVYYAQNEVYAIHGKKFKSQKLQEYFNSKNWYCYFANTYSQIRQKKRRLSYPENGEVEIVKCW